MSKKQSLILILVIVAIAASAGIACFFVSRPAESEPSAHVATNDHATHGAVVFEEGIPSADPMIVGKWQNAANKGWHKVYYDDYDEEEQLYWGKEWDETEDVQEEDLDYHGNGWFRWEKKGKILREYATMSMRDVPILREYKVKVSACDSLIYYEPKYKKRIYRFSKVGN